MIIILLTLTGCAEVSVEEKVVSSDQELPSNYFEHINQCANTWQKLLDEWEGHGGGIRESIMAMRSQIQGDNKSGFAKLVKAAWRHQEEQGYYELSDRLGSWPVSSDSWRSVTVFPFPKEMVPENCTPLSWLTPLIWGELYTKNLDKLIEAPETMKWESPSAPHWVMYWLFVRII